MIVYSSTVGRTSRESKQTSS